LLYRVNYFTDYADADRKPVAEMCEFLADEHPASLCTPELNSDRKMHILIIPAAPMTRRFNKLTLCGSDAYGFVHYSLWPEVREWFGYSDLRKHFCKQCIASMHLRERTGEFSDRIMLRLLAAAT
jgi:hypothetical protein